MPFTLHEGHLILVEGRVIHGNRVNLVIDTGANYTFVSRKAAERLGLKMLSGSSQAGAFGRRTSVERAIIRGLRFGPVLVTLPCFVADLPWNGVDLIVGLDILRRTSFAIDYASKRILFGSDQRLGSTTPIDPESSMLIVQSEVAGQPVRLSVDTGADQMSLYENHMKSWIRRVPGRNVTLIHAAGSTQAREVSLPRVRIGASQWTQLPALILRTSDQRSDRDGVLGVASLGLKRIHFDFENRRISWDR